LQAFAQSVFARHDPVSFVSRPHKFLDRHQQVFRHPPSAFSGLSVLALTEIR